MSYLAKSIRFLCNTVFDQSRKEVRKNKSEEHRGVKSQEVYRNRTDPSIFLSSEVG